jgi:signal peptidase II
MRFNLSKNKLLFAIAACVVIIGDQLSKMMIRQVIAPGDEIFISPILQFRLFYNDGLSFGISAHPIVITVLLSGAFLSLLWLFWRYLSFGTTLSFVAFGLVVGGALGNIIDRLRFGYVIDFIHVFSISVLNVADIAIYIGIAILLGVLFLFDREDSVRN